VTGRILFKLNFGRYPWKGNLVIQIEIPRVEEFLAGIQKSWKQAIKAMEEAQKNMKRQFDKKRWNPQSVVATTRYSRTNDLTTSKTLSRAIK